MPDAPPTRSLHRQLSGGPAREVIGAALVAVAALLLSHLLTPRGTVENDVDYYRQWAQWAGDHGFAGAMREYPTPVAVLLWLPTLVAPTAESYFRVFVAAGVALAGATTLALLALPGRAGARGPDAPAGTGALAAPAPTSAGPRAAVVFLLSLGALGPITFYRFDLLPGALLALACVCLARGWRGWSVAVALGTGIKLWPVITWPLVLGRRATRRRELASFALTGILLVAVSVAVAGWERLFSPLQWQSGRGLQVESVLASWVLLARVVSPSTWTAQLSSANSWDFTGPGVPATLLVGTLVQVVLLVWVVAITGRLWRTCGADAAQVALAAASVVAVLLATNKVFSPQYVMWLAPVAAVAIALGGGRVPGWWAPVLVATSFLTQLSYPATYGWLYSGSTGWTFLVGTVVMLVRNGLVVALALSLCRAAWRASGSARTPLPSRHRSAAPSRPTIDEGGAALVPAEDPRADDVTGRAHPDPARPGPAQPGPVHPDPADRHPVTPTHPTTEETP